MHRVGNIPDLHVAAGAPSTLLAEAQALRGATVGRVIEAAVTRICALRETA